MNARRMVEHRDSFMGEPLVYYVETCESLPEPSQDDPYAKDGRAATVRTVDNPLPEPPAKRRPSKAEFIRSYEQACGGDYPACVLETVATVYSTLLIFADHFERTHKPQPRRLRRAMARFSGNDLASFYDTGTIARIRWYFEQHRQRWQRERDALNEMSRSLFERDGRVHPMTLGAVVGAR